MENDIDNRIKKQKRNNNGENALNMDGRQPLVNRNSDIVRNNNVSNGNSSSKRLSHFSAVGIDKKKKTEKDGNKRITGGSENFFATLFASSSSSNSKKQTKGKRKSSLASISIGNIETQNIATPVGERNTENSDDDYENDDDYVEESMVMPLPPSSSNMNLMDSLFGWNNSYNP